MNVYRDHHLWDGNWNQEIVDILDSVDSIISHDDFKLKVHRLLLFHGFSVTSSFRVADRGDGHTGAVDLVAKKGDLSVAIEINNGEIKDKSKIKIVQVPNTGFWIIYCRKFGLNNDKQIISPINKTIETVKNNLIQIYSDGGFFNHLPTWGFVVVRDGKVIFTDKGVLSQNLSDGRQIAGELRGVMEGVCYCRQNLCKGDFFVDYIGCIGWVQDFFNKYKKPWRTNKEYTKEYRDFIYQNLEHINSINWLKGHNKNEFNELADTLASHPEKFDDTKIN